MSTNEYGLDVSYFQKWLARLADINRFTPDELAREFARMSRAADPNVLLEAEFGHPQPINGEWWMCFSEEFKRCAPMIRVDSGWSSITEDDGTPLESFISPDGRLEPLYPMMPAPIRKYGKVKGHHCWWLTIYGKSVANFDKESDVDGIITTESLTQA